MKKITIPTLLLILFFVLTDFSFAQRTYRKLKAVRFIDEVTGEKCCGFGGQGVGVRTLRFQGQDRLLPFLNLLRNITKTRPDSFGFTKNPPVCNQQNKPACLPGQSAQCICRKCPGCGCGWECVGSQGGGGDGGGGGTKCGDNICAAGERCCSGVPYFQPTCEPREKGCKRCLSSQTNIATPFGEVNVKNLKIGLLIWTLDKNGKKVSAPIIKLSKLPAPNHQVVNLILSDGRKLQISAGHPTADGRLVSDLQIGDQYDGSVVISADSVRYEDTYTYDLLPVGDTGYYWADGVLLGSTLK